MSENTKKGPIVNPGLCRGCGAMKKCRILNVKYEWLGCKEVYSDMFVDTFGLLLSHLDGEESERLICATCVTRLREATAFRKQVLNCEEHLLQSLLLDSDSIDPAVINEIKGEYSTAAPSNDNAVNTESNVINSNIVNHNIINNQNHLNLIDMDDAYSLGNSPLNNVEVDYDNIPNHEAAAIDQLLTASTDCTKKQKKPKSKKTKKECLKESQKIEDMKNTDNKQIDTDTLERRQEMRQRTEFNKRSLENIVTIVQNSYVCPFDTSFSDYYCFYCREVITDPDRLREHTLTHDPSTFQEAFSSIYTKKTLQIDIMRIDCRLCPENINEMDNFKLHIAEAHGIKMHAIENDFLKFRLTANNLSCIECGTVFSFFHALKKHMAEHFGSCTCDVCGAQYFDERMLSLHKKTHEKVDVSFPCRECGKIFKCKQSRQMHENKIHRKEPSYQCPKCDMEFFSYSLRYRHLIEAHGEQRLFRCDHCDKAYDSRKSLREHNRRVHVKTFLHQCDLCDKRFYLPSRLKEHMSTHTGERNFRCEYCGKSYPRMRGLKVHMQSHSRDKRYKCVLCNASFTQNANLKNHVRKQHQTLEAGVGFQDRIEIDIC